MNNPSPLMPQGSLLEQKNKSRAKVKIAVFFVLAVHAIGLLALLMQGCNKEPKTTQTEQTNTIASAPEFTPTNTPQLVDTTSIPAVPPVTNTVAEIPAAPTDYTIVAGDSFSKISARFHVTVSALMAANPGIEPTKLQVGKKIKIPPPAPATSTTTQAMPPANGETVYSVKSGDTLGKIAETFHTTVNALRTANSLKTDNIRVGQKLTIPKAGSASDTTPANGTTSAPK